MSHVLAILWFDTEDFIDPESDDMPLQIARLMDKYGIKVVFKIVGEKQRFLMKNNRQDVIDAMARHDIGYHTNLHSIHPIMSEYVGNSDWDTGLSEFAMNEEPGYEELMSAYGRVNCFGHPGLSWVPQAYPPLLKWGIKVYLDETFSITPIGERPFWYGNILNLMCLGSNVLSLDASGTYNPTGEKLATVKDDLVKTYEKLRSENEVGLISVFCHPNTYCTWQFWDTLNYSKGKNPPEGKFTKPRMKTAEETKRDFENLENFLVALKSLPELSVITSDEALKIYHDKASERGFSSSEIAKLCEATSHSVKYISSDHDVWLSAAELFSLVLYSLDKYWRTGELPPYVFAGHPFGPKREATIASSSGEIQVEKFLEDCSKEYNKIQRTGYLSDTFRIGSSEFSPADMFATCCELFLKLFRREKVGSVRALEGNFEVGKMVTEEGAARDWKYYLSPDDFAAPEQVKLARLQTWTLKPAVPDLAVLSALRK